MDFRGLKTLSGDRRALWYAGFALYAAGVALFSGPGLDHWWGVWAAGGYAVAALITVAARARAWSRPLAVAASLAGALAGPALWLMLRYPAPPDVAVVARSGGLLLHHGTPYLPAAALPAGGWLAYNPYLPVMALFGLPHALGVPGDTRPWLIAATFLLLYATFLVTRRTRVTRGTRAEGGWRAAAGQAAFWLACPVMAFPLTMGITDPPVIALTCLALALLAGRGATLGRVAGNRVTLLAAVVLGVACAMKYTAWPALAIIAIMVAARDGVRSASRFTAVAGVTAAGLVAALAPAALRHPASVAANTVAYPLGLTAAKSPAQSPLPGHLLSTLGSGGHTAALALLAAAGLAVAVSLVVAPPTTPAAAARRLAIGLTALFLLSPATRFGYFIYPIALCWWAVIAERSAGLVVEPHAMGAVGVDGQPARAGNAGQRPGAARRDDGEVLGRAVAARGRGRVHEVEGALAAADRAFEGLHRHVGANAGRLVERGGENRRRTPGDLPFEVLLHNRDPNRQGGADDRLNGEAGRVEGFHGERSVSSHEKTLLTASDIRRLTS
jgi:hypothetical protein